MGSRAHNKNIHTVNKYSHEYLFYNYTEKLSKRRRKYEKNSGFEVKIFNPIKLNSKVLFSVHYIKKGNILYCNKLRATGKKC